MPSKEINFTLKLEADKPFRLKDKVQIIQSISELPSADQQRIIEICKNQKALKSISDNWEMLQTMFK